MLARNLIVETPNYEYDILHEKSNREGEERYYIQGPYMQFGVKNKNNRSYQEREMVEDVQRYKTEMIDKGRAGGELNHCVPDHYEILTANGWKNLYDVKNDESIYTLNTDTNEIEEEVIREVVNEEYDGKMIRFKGRNINAIFTPNHRILVQLRTGVKEYMTAQDIFDNKNTSKISHAFIPKTGEWKKESPKTFTLKGIKDVAKLGNYKNDVSKDIEVDYNTFVSFLGLYLAEGHTKKGSGQYGRHYGVYITQKKATFMNDIEELLSLFPDELEWTKGDEGFYCFDRRLWEYVKPLGDCYSKFIPQEIKNESSADDLNDLVYWFNVGDGRFSTTGEYTQRTIFTVSKDLINDLNECVVKSGKSSNLSLIEPNDSIINGREILAENCQVLNLLNLSKTKGIYLDPRFIEITEEDFSGRIGCVVAPKNTNWYCRDDFGKCFWTGNSPDPEIKLDRMCHKIVNLERDGNLFIGKSMVLSTPQGKILESLIKDKVNFGMSTKSLGQIQESKDGVDVVSDFMLIGVDAVYDPSCTEAFVNGILENKQFIINTSGKYEQTYEKFEKGLSKYPSSHSEHINNHIKEQIQMFLESLKK